MTKFDSHNINAAHTQRELEQAESEAGGDYWVHLRKAMEDYFSSNEPAREFRLPVHTKEKHMMDPLTDIDAALARQARINQLIEEDAMLFCERTKQWMERG